MNDWRQISNEARERKDQLTVRDSGKGLILAFLDTSSGETQTAKIVYSGGEKNIPLPMPFDSSDSWLRSIPETSTSCIVGFRADNGDPTFVSYVNETPKSKLDAYRAGDGLYRPLAPGEHEIHSSGGANVYLSRRPNMELRAGLVRSWLDQDRLEAGAKSPLHVRQLWEHKSNSVGDEERIGVVRRPMNFLLKNPAAAILALSVTSYNFYDYPYPDYTIPTGIGGVGAQAGVVAEVAAAASAVALGLAGKFKQRTFGKEYLRVLKNPLYPLPPNKYLIDIREGQVFDDNGIQLISLSSGAYLRSQHKFFTPLGVDATTYSVDELGNVQWDLAIAAMTGFTINVPTGYFHLTTSVDTEILCLNLNTVSMLATNISATTDLALQAQTAGVSIDAAFNFSNSVATGDYTLDVTAGSIKQTANLNVALVAKTGTFDGSAGVKMTLTAPKMDIGHTPNTPMVLGNELLKWLLELVSVMISNAPNFCTGNLGAPSFLNPAIAQKLVELQAKVTAAPTSPLTSKSIQVSI